MGAFLGMFLLVSGVGYGLGLIGDKEYATLSAVILVSAGFICLTIGSVADKIVDAIKAQKTESANSPGTPTQSVSGS